MGHIGEPEYCRVVIGLRGLPETSRRGNHTELSPVTTNTNTNTNTYTQIQMTIAQNIIIASEIKDTSRAKTNKT